MEYIGLLVGAIGVPVCAVVANIAIRHIGKVPITAGADLILFLLTFDGAVLIAHENFQPLVVSNSFRNQLNAIFVMLTFLGFATWVVNIGYFERKLIDAYDGRNHRYSDFPLVWFICSWAIVVLLIAAHVLTFTLNI